MKKSFVFIFIFTLGIILGKFTFSSQETLTANAYQKQLEALQEKHEKLDMKYRSLEKAATNLSNIDIKEYTELKTLEEKYKKADEILGKIMLLFLANIKVKLEKNVSDYFSDSHRSLPSKKVIPIENTKTMDVNKYLKPSEESFTKISFPIKVNNPEFDEVSKNIEPTLINNPYQFYKNAKAAKNFKEIRFLKGKFEGELYLIKGKYQGTTDKVLLDLNFYEEEGKLKGEYLSQLLRDGQAYSTNRGGGDNAQIRTVANKPNQVLLETSPNSFIHLEIKKRNDYYIGKYYDDNEYKGLVKLYRSN